MSIVLELVVTCVVCSVAIQVQIAHYSLPWLWTALTNFYLRTYAEGLPQEAKERYMKKISTIDNADPFLNGSKIGEATEEVPPVDALDLVSYLVLQTSFVTSSQFKACRGLEAYNQL